MREARSQRNERHRHSYYGPDEVLGASSAPPRPILGELDNVLGTKRS